jgi:hypothetical protein
MNKILVFLVSIIVIGMVIMFFFQDHPREDLLTGELPPITESELDSVLKMFVDSHDSNIIEVYGDSFKREFLINLVHIKKEGSEYKISCKFGPYYKTANLYKLFPDELVSMGQIRECNIETAKGIDKAVYSSEMDCWLLWEKKKK